MLWNSIVTTPDSGSNVQTTTHRRDARDRFLPFRAARSPDPRVQHTSCDHRVQHQQDKLSALQSPKLSNLKYQWTNTMSTHVNTARIEIALAPQEAGRAISMMSGNNMPPARPDHVP